MINEMKREMNSTKDSLIRRHLHWLLEGRDYYGLLPEDEVAAYRVAWRYHIEMTGEPRK